MLERAVNEFAITNVSHLKGVHIQLWVVSYALSAKISAPGNGTQFSSVNFYTEIDVIKLKVT